MVTTTIQGVQNFLERFSEFENGAGGPSWLRRIRRAAIDRFSALGYPTTRDEDWKFTNVAPIAQTTFALADGGAQPSARELAPFHFPELEGTRLVFVNGRYAEDLSTVRGLPAGVRVGSLAQAFQEDEELLKQHLAKYVDYEHDAFSALNTAFITDGGLVHIGRGVVLEEPIHLLYVATRSRTPTVTHPRNLVVAEEGSEASVVEEYVSLDAGVYFSNVVTEVVAGDNAVLSHYVIERESTEAYSVGTLRVQQGRSSNFTSHTVLLGGALVRNNVHPVLAGEGGECLINGLFMPGDQQHMDNFMLVEHASPHCDSRQFYNGILSGRSRGVFSGRIVVHKDAQKTDAKQTNRNLLLSDDAQVDSKPQLEIYADDVKCTHGATIGQLDDDAIFYLRARGISEHLARALLLSGFAGENLERMKLEPVRRYIEELVIEKLPEGDLLREIR